MTEVSLATEYRARLERFAPAMRYEDGTLWIEGMRASDLARRFGTPLFVYSKHAFLTRAQEFQRLAEALGAHVYVAVKANDNRTLLALLHETGFGADCVSGGELARALDAGYAPSEIEFNGNGKGDAELIRAHREEIGLIVVDSLFELEAVVATAELCGRPQVPIGLRLNPDIDAATHPYLSTAIAASKFGLPPDDIAPALDYIKAHPSLALVNLHTHLGSMISEPTPYRQTARFLRAQAEARRAEGFPIASITLGGGFAVPYATAKPFQIEPFIEAVRTEMAGSDLEINLEPGRYLFAESALLLMSVRGMKRTPTKTFCVVDAGMTDNIRPALYDAHHPAVPVRLSDEGVTCDLVGPICESGDFLAQDLVLPPMERDDLIAQLSVGAYCYAMSSRYNGRPRPAEVLVEGDRAAVIREAEDLEDLARQDHQLG